MRARSREDKIDTGLLLEPGAAQEKYNLYAYTNFKKSGTGVSTKIRLLLGLRYVTGNNLEGD